MIASKLNEGDRYNWKGQPERLIYLGRRSYPHDMRFWYQFAKVEKPDEVWCEVLEDQLESFEKSAT